MMGLTDKQNGQLEYDRIRDFKQSKTISGYTTYVLHNRIEQLGELGAIAINNIN